MSVTAIIKTSFYGRNGAGVISVPDVLAGDVMLVAGIAGTRALTSQFWPLINTDGEVYQDYAGDNSAETFTAVFVRQS